MNIYTFRNTKTDELLTFHMSYEQYLEFIKNKKKYLVQEFHINTGDSILLGVTRPPSDFQKYVVDRIKHSVPGANRKTMEKRWHTTKEI